LNAEKSVSGHVKKSITSSFFNRITFYLAVKCKRFYSKIPNGCWENGEKI